MIIYNSRNFETSVNETLKKNIMYKFEKQILKDANLPKQTRMKHLSV